MTYSRPSNGEVSVQAGGGGGNTGGVRFSAGSSVSRNGTQRNNVNPDLIYKNGMDKAKQIGEFVDFFTDTVVPQIGKELDRRANNEAGEYLQGVDPTDVTSTGDEDNIAKFNNLNPRAQSIVTNARGLQATAMYPAAYRANLSSNPKAFTTGNSPEALEIRATAKAKAKAQALEDVGLLALPPYQVAKNAELLAKADGIVNGDLYARRIRTEADERRQVLTTEGGTLLANVYSGTQQLAATTEDGRGVENRGMRGYLEGFIQSSGETESAKTQAFLLLGIIGEASTNMNPAETQKMLADLKAQRNNPLEAVDGSNLWDVPITMGEQTVTISQKLDELESASQVDADRYLRQQLGAEMTRLVFAENDIAGARALWVSNRDLMNDISNWAALESIITNGSNMESPEMIRNQNDIERRILLGETTALKATLEIFDGEPGRVSKRWLEGLTRRAQREKEKGELGISPDKAAFTAYDAQKNTSNNDLINKQFEQELKLNIPATAPEGWQENNRGTTWDVYRRGEIINAEKDSRDFFIQEFNESVAEGKPIDPLKIYERSQARALANLRERAKKNNTKGPVSPAAALTSKSRTVQKALNEAMIANGGKVTIPISVLGEDGKAKLQAQGKAWGSLSLKEQTNALANTFVGMEMKNKAGESVRIDTTKAADMARQMIQNAKKAGAAAPPAAVPERVPVTEKEEEAAREAAKAEGYTSPAYKATTEILESVTGYLKKDLKKDSGIPALEGIKNWFNNDGMGDQSMKYVEGFLNLITGVQPAAAAPLTYGTPDGLASLRQAWKYGSQGLKTGPLPQVAASAQARPVPTAVGNDQHELFVMIGVAEGTRTPNGGYTKAYYGHSDPGDSNYNRGTVSGGRNSSASPEMIDQKWMGILTNMQQRMRPQLIVLGLMPGTQGYNRVMFNLMDLTVQSPKAAQDFAGSLFGTVRQAGFTIEAIAKARADSFINPATGRLEASGFGNNYQALIKDQRSRAGVYDYRRRL